MSRAAGRDGGGRSGPRPDMVLHPAWPLGPVLLAPVLAPVVGEGSRGLGQPVGVYALGLGLGVLVTASVMLHELAHAVVARRRGVGVRRITITPWGGHTDLAAGPRPPAVSAAIAAAGPALNLVLGGVSWLLATAFDAGPVGRSLQVLAVANAAIGLFNLLPGLPMDGGQILRAALIASGRSPAQATRTAAWSGRAVAVLLAGGLLLLAFVRRDAVPRPLWAVGLIAAMAIGGSLWAASGQALRITRPHAARTGADARTATPAQGPPDVRTAVDLMVPALLVPPEATVAQALDLVQDGRSDLLLWSAEEEAVLGRLTREALHAVLGRDGDGVPARLAARPVRDGSWVDARLSGPVLDGVLADLRRDGSRPDVAVVHRDGIPIGVLDPARIGAEGAA